MRRYIPPWLPICDDRQDRELLERTGVSMNDKDNPHQRMTQPSRDERLKVALRENLKKRKAQARGRAGMTVITPEDDARARKAQAGRQDTEE